MTPAPQPMPAPVGGATSPAAPASGAPAKSDRLLKLIAAERFLRGFVLIAIGLVLITHAHTDWGRWISDTSREAGLDPSGNGIQKLIAKVQAISPNKYVVFGVVAIAYGLLEGVEGYGLWLRRRWAEYLTVVVTSLLFVPEVYEIAKHATPLKVGALVVNAAIVAYLIWRLRHNE